MPEIEPKDQRLKSLRGLHLWHAPMSSCSQRVRIALAETDQAFESHIINLERDEHASAAYQAIHPKGLVPALVKDGALWIESVDILALIAEGSDAFSPGDAADLMALADGSQLDLKLLTFEFLFRSSPPAPEDAAAAFQQNHGNDWLKQFRLDFVNGFAPERLNAAIARIDAGFWTLEERLADGRSYLGGDGFSMVDVAWMPNLHRFSLMDWPVHRYPRLSDWFDRVRARASYGKGLIEWQPDPVQGAFAEYTAMRRAQGTDVTSFPHFRDPNGPVS